MEISPTSFITTALILINIYNIDSWIEKFEELDCDTS